MRVAAVSVLASAALCFASEEVLPSTPPVSKADAFAAALRGGKGFADADLDSDESMKMIRNAGLHHTHGGHKTVRPRSSTARNSDMRAIQGEVESMVHRVKLLSDEDAFEFIKELDDIEDTLAKSSAQDQSLVGEISSVRAELCTRKGFTGTEASECEDFMHKACVIDAIGRDKDATPLVPEEDCLKFYSMGGRVDTKATAKSAPAPAGAPAPAPVSAPASEPDGWSMKVRPLPDQGFQGPLKMHKDMDTAVKDWRREFGPKSGQQSYKEICAQYPKNEWCRLHGFFRTPVASEMKSGAAARPFAAGLLAVVAAMLSW